MCSAPALILVPHQGTQEWTGQALPLRSSQSSEEEEQVTNKIHTIREQPGPGPQRVGGSERHPGKVSQPFQNWSHASFNFLFLYRKMHVFVLDHWPHMRGGLGSIPRTIKNTCILNARTLMHNSVNLQHTDHERAGATSHSPLLPASETVRDGHGHQGQRHSQGVLPMSLLIIQGMSV